MAEHFTTDQLAADRWRRRKERALRWGRTNLKDYPAVDLAEETDETLAAEPLATEEQQRRKRKQTDEPT